MSPRWSARFRATSSRASTQTSCKKGFPIGQQNKTRRPSLHSPGGPRRAAHSLNRATRKSTLKSIGLYIEEHFPNASFGVYPVENDTKLAILIVGSKYSPKNFWYVWNG